VAFSATRSHPSSLLFAKFVRVCACWKTLGKEGPADFAAIRDVAHNDKDLKVDVRSDWTKLLITLPQHGRVDANGAPRRTNKGRRVDGTKEAFRKGLRHRQLVVCACICGKLTGRGQIPVIEFSNKRETTRAKAAAKAKKRADARDKDNDAGDAVAAAAQAATKAAAAAASAATAASAVAAALAAGIESASTVAAAARAAAEAAAVAIRASSAVAPAAKGRAAVEVERNDGM